MNPFDLRAMIDQYGWAGVEAAKKKLTGAGREARKDPLGAGKKALRGTAAAALRLGLTPFDLMTGVANETPGTRPAGMGEIPLPSDVAVDALPGTSGDLGDVVEFGLGFLNPESAALGMAAGGMGKAGRARKAIRAALQGSDAILDVRKLSPEEALKAVRKGAHLKRTGAGKFVGAPDWIDSPAKLGANRARMRDEVKRAAELIPEARTWYPRAQDYILETTAPGDAAKQHLRARAHGLFSSRNSPETDLGFTIEANNRYAAGHPPGIINDRAKAKTYYAARDAGVDIPLGDKTEPYAVRLDPTLPMEGPFENASVNDFRNMRFLGHRGKDGKPFKGAATPQQHAFGDAEMLLLTDELNRRAVGGVTDWDAASSQASPWVLQKAESLMKQRPSLTLEEALAEANKTYADFLPKHTAYATDEAVPGVGTGHRQDITEGSEEVRRKFTDEVFDIVAPGGRDRVAEAMDIIQRPQTHATGLYQSRGGPVENNDVRVSRLLASFEPTPGGGKRFSPATRELFEARANYLAPLLFQNGMAGSMPIKPTSGTNSDLLKSLFVPMDRKLTAEELLTLKNDIGPRYGLPDPLDYGEGTMLTNLGFNDDIPIRSGVELRKDLEQPGGLTSELKGLLGDKIEPTRVERDDWYEDYQDLLRAENEGKGLASRKMYEHLRARPAIYDKLNRSEDLRAMNREMMEYDMASPTSRRDKINLHRILSEGGLDALGQALKEGKIPLPALGGLGLGIGSLYPKDPGWE